jgi:hypothetical protein
MYLEMNQMYYKLNDYSKYEEDLQNCHDISQIQILDSLIFFLYSIFKIWFLPLNEENNINNNNCLIVLIYKYNVSNWENIIYQKII